MAWKFAGFKSYRELLVASEAQVAARNPTSLKELKKAIVNVWVEEISPAYCEKLCLSMRTRIANVIANKGKHTKY